MEDNVAQYIDSKFEALTKNIKWIAGIFITVITLLFGYVGTTAVNNRLKIKELEHKTAAIDLKMETLEMKSRWMNAFSDLLKTHVINNKGRVNEDILERVQIMEEAIMAIDIPETPDLKNK